MSTALDLTKMRHGTELLKRGFAKMQEGGVIMDVVTPEEAHIAEDAGAVSVMALERVPADIRAMAPPQGRLLGDELVDRPHVTPAVE